MRAAQDCTLKNKQCRVLVSEREVHKNYEFFMTEIRNNNYEKSQWYFKSTKVRANKF